MSVTVSGSGSRIRDQIFLPARGLTDEEILVQRRQLATDYRFNLALGVWLTFGSIYNNVVNSRFAGSSGGIVRRSERRARVIRVGLTVTAIGHRSERSRSRLGHVVLPPRVA